MQYNLLLGEDMIILIWLILVFLNLKYLYKLIVNKAS